MQNDVDEQPNHASLREDIEALKVELAELRDDRSEREAAWKRWFAAVGTASVTLLAFLIPSLQDQWDRKRQVDAEAEYRAVAAALERDGNYHEAEQLLGQAVEQAGALRPDLERARLRAKTEQVNTDPAWSGTITSDLSEADFIVLEAMLARDNDRPAEARAMNNHAVFVANHGEPKRALSLVRRAEQLQPRDARLQITAGNVLWDLGVLSAAREAYRSALSLDPENARAHYNLGLLYEELGDRAQAARELRVSLTKDATGDTREDLARVEGKTPHANASHSGDDAI
jgi:Flp pilus assembly protein TadD